MQLAGSAALAAPEVDTGVIRLGREEPSSGEERPTERVRVEAPRRSLDYESFQTRLEALWFQRKTFLASGRTADAEAQLEQIRALCAEEGVRRLAQFAGALVAESGRYMAQGDHGKALAALRHAEAFDPGRPQIPFARAAVHWRSEGGVVRAAGEFLEAVRRSLIRAVRELSLVHQLAFVAVLAMGASLLLFAALMVLRYHVPFRHEVEEWALGFAPEPWPGVLGWTLLLLPLLLWVTAGWIALFWIVITFRFMTRAERVAALLLLAVSALAVPAYRVAVGLYGMTANPAVRTTLGSVDGEYDPDRIVRLRQLVKSHPDDAVYRLLLAGLYKNGQYYEEAFAEYKTALELDPTLTAAWINIGNIFYTTGQYSEAIANYRRAIEQEPSSVLAHFNMHLAQSESFRFAAAEESLARAREIDAKQVAELLRGATDWGQRPGIHDSAPQMASVWESALGGEDVFTSAEARGPRSGSHGFGLLHPVGIVSLAALCSCLFIGWIGGRQEPARCCVRCGRPFCSHCKSWREGHEYCSQCLHLYVLGDGLAPGTKSRKLYEVERHELLSRRIRRWGSVLLPGTAQLLKGRTGRGVLLILAWVAAWVAFEPRILVPFEQLSGMSLPLHLLTSADVPARFTLSAIGVLGLAMLPAVWFIGNAWRWRRRDA